ncbi:hypothetical protein [Paraburkholderia ultramafica]|uniref:HoxN/HupN/NixA family nickel/cobalt transporter n=1 Tax=Paraburkholderia ultramafica TaxID=1544867 RepID=UPI003CCD47D1
MAQCVAQQGASNAWLFIPSAILLGALHGLEPGHSKTMMAAFIVAIRGTVGQAVLPGLSATLSHTAVVWAVALVGVYLGRNWNPEASEPYFQVASAVLIVGVAAWMIGPTWRQQKAAHDHDHEHDHHHHGESRHIDTGHGVVRLDVFEDGVPPRFRLYHEGTRGHQWAADQVRIETERADGSRQTFPFVQRDGFVESVQEHAHKHHHDEHHQHEHDFPYDGDEPHTHPHAHLPITHSHAHYPDIHHRHQH